MTEDQQVEENEYEIPPSRRQKLLNKHRGCLRCEWCNKWTESDGTTWWKIYNADRDYIWYCKRPRCVAWRRETLEVPSE